MKKISKSSINFYKKNGYLILKKKKLVKRILIKLVQDYPF